MFGSNRNRAASFLLLGFTLGGCSSTGPKAVATSDPVAPPAPPVILVLSVNTPVHIIAANPSGKAVLEHDIPDLMANKCYPLVDDMSLVQIASVSGGRFTTAKLNQLEADLSRIQVSE